MAIGPFSSSSTAEQKQIQVSDSGQYNQHSDVSQGGSVLVGRKATLTLPGGLSGIKLEKGSSLTINNTGPDQATLQGLIGELGQQPVSQSVVPIIPAQPQTPTGSQAASDSSGTAAPAFDWTKLEVPALLGLVGFFLLKR